MIYGVGVDIVSVTRMEKACIKESFLKHTYSCKEIELYRGDISKLSANFAAKEAFSKALGTGVRGFDLKDVQLFRDELGKPYYCFAGKALDIIETKKLISHVSVSDEGDTVIVFAILDKLIEK